MTGARSLRRDLALGLGAGLTVLWILAMLGASLIMHEELDEVYDSLMEETADRLLPLALGRGTENLPPQAEALLTWVLRDTTGAVLLRSGEAEDATFATPAPDGFSTLGDHRHFVRSLNGRSLDIASPLQERREAMRGVMTALLLPALILLPLCLLGIVWFTNTRLCPVAALSAEVAGRHPDDLRPLATSGLQSEIVPVRDEMNRLMASLSRTLDAERAFSANAAHELRTPIAATLAHVQMLLAEAPDGPLHDRARVVEDELKRVTRLVEKILQLARAEHAAVGGATADARAVLRLVAGDFGLYPDLPDDPVPLPIDTDAFAIMARNLIENAVTHGQEVEVALSPDSVLRVANGGQVVPAADLARLTQRFERMGTRNAGSGLGLAIVAAIARNAGFGLELLSPRPGRPDGFMAVLRPPQPAASVQAD
ncbi:histidine kinase dimerization/phospho-acceptor domain-containing protein [Falsirhodobacter sp. 20TX0035]|uniref:histidine kinase dimerization/phospho-acceptor domain-containing protein n=1 Tax=Falsirhodobacter sp. 20TX0035 TaxID=3022019 RepID=UPI00232ADAC2|nr:histidine kinase dimerization/phospho-acceptor domain-containing protein [Falsirhodobacter sp. 20TX0035]MDB6454456.1 histidine kinase dimerization/phospho-acceptor domain-containing protein [Falsirhodobacter sp. 20TX0035]